MGTIVVGIDTLFSDKVKVKGKGKAYVQPTTGHEGPNGE
jgi:hypothetical protein